MDFVKYFFEFLFGKGESTANKVFFIFIAIILLIFVNQTLGFSYNYYHEKKIENISDIQKLLDNDKLTPEQKSKLTALQNEIINSTRNISFEHRTSRFWSFSYIVSYCGLVIIVGVIALFSPVNSTTFKQILLHIFWTTVIVVITTLILAAFAWFFAYIPSSIISHVLNAILQLIALGGIYYASERLNFKT